MAKVAKRSYNAELGEVRFAFVNGVVVTLRLDELSEDMVRQAALHGLVQKVGDVYAGAGEKDWSVADCVEAVEEVVGALKEGVWSRGAVGGRAGDILTEALVRVTKRPWAECLGVIQELTSEQRKELGKRPEVKAAVLGIQAERAQARVKVGAGAADVGDLEDLF